MLAIVLVSTALLAGALLACHLLNEYTFLKLYEFSSEVCSLLVSYGLYQCEHPRNNYSFIKRGTLCSKSVDTPNKYVSYWRVMLLIKRLKHNKITPEGVLAYIDKHGKPAVTPWEKF